MIAEDNIPNNKVEIPVDQLLGQVLAPRHHQFRGANHHLQLFDDTERLQVRDINLYISDPISQSST